MATPSPSGTRRLPVIHPSRLRAVVDELVAHSPMQLGFVQALWNRTAVQNLLAERAGCFVSEVRVWGALRRGGLGLHWPRIDRGGDENSVSRRRRFYRLREEAREHGADIVLLTCQSIALRRPEAPVRTMHTLNAVGPYSDHRFLALPAGPTETSLARFVEDVAKTGRSQTWLAVDETLPVATLQAHAARTRKRVNVFALQETPQASHRHAPERQLIATCPEMPT